MPPKAQNIHAHKGELWGSVLVLAFVSAFFITIIAVCYGVIVSPRTVPGVIPTIAFPWLGWFVALCVSTALILGFGQFIARKNLDAEEDKIDQAELNWASQLPQRAQRIYRFIKDAPLIMVCTGLILLGATLLVIDGAFSLVLGVLQSLMPYLPFIIGGLALFSISIAAIMAWSRHAEKKLMAEYAFRREVLEKTGVILLNDKGKAVLPPGEGRTGYATVTIDAGAPEEGPLLEAEIIQALPAGEEQGHKTSPSDKGKDA